MHVGLQTDDSPSVTSHLVPYYVPINVQSHAKYDRLIDIIENDDSAVSFHTGLPSWAIFEYINSVLLKTRKQSQLFKLSSSEGLLLTLMRLRLNLTIADLGYRFRISETTVRDTFNRNIDALFTNFQCLIKWPSKEVCKENLPQIFKDLYPKASCIIDCSEIFIERPYGYLARAQTYSNYKKNNTIKFLIAVTPCGAICFLSKCWGGRASDRCITANSGFLEKLTAGDVVLADRGFNIAEELALYGAKLEIPAFTKGKTQLSLKEVEESKRLSKVRIHVERVMKNKYVILQTVLPINILRHNSDTEYSNIDKILIICAAFTNLSQCVVPA